MHRVLTTTSWVFATLGVGALVALPLLGDEPGPIAALVAVAATVVAVLTAVRVHRVPLVYPAVATATCAYVVLTTVLLNDPDDPGVDTATAVIDLLTNLSLMIGLVFALRARRGPYSWRDLVDGATVLAGGTVIAWLAVARPLLDDVGAANAVLAAAYLPFGAALVALIVALMLNDLQANRTMWLLTAAFVLNYAADLLRGGARAGLGTGAADLAAACYLGGFMIGVAALVHPSMPEVLERRATPPHVRANVRLLLMTAALLVPIALIAAVPGDSVPDLTVRTVAAVVLIGLGALRLVHAIRASHAARDELLERIQLDHLTRLPNRTSLVESLTDVLERTWRSEQRPALLQLNLDRFKNINDSLGHDAANEVLRAVADRLTEATAEYGAIVSRPSGDDFIVLDPGVVSSSQALARAEAVQAALEEPFTVGDHTVFVTASLGLVVAPKKRSITPEEFLRRVDIATHRAKSNGRNCIALFDESMQESLTQRMDVENALYGAVDRQEMRLYHQPIVDIATGEISGFEALIRWRRADGTIVPPSDFVPIAEETGMINALGTWAMLEALCELRRWIDDGTVPPTTTMSVNVSPRQIADPHFPDVVHEALARSGIPPHLLWLEVTESMMLSEPDLARNTLRRVRAMGVRLALDDFGTGYSSLSLLQKFPLQRIKIDRAFVHGVADRSNDRSLVRTIIAMGSSLGLDIVAEGVESIHQLTTLRDLGCAKAQGYLISHPIPADAMRSTMVALRDLASLSFFGTAAADGTGPESVAPSADSAPGTTSDRHGLADPVRRPDLLTGH